MSSEHPITPVGGSVERDGVAPTSIALLVDDDPAIRRLCRSVLVRDGWDVQEAGDGEEALAFCRDKTPDIIIMDVSMPIMDGIEATRRLRAAPETEGIPIVMLSGHGESTVIESALGAGADGYICKPISVREFALRIRSFSRLRRAWRELQRGRSTLGEQARALSLLLAFSDALARHADIPSVLTSMIDVTMEMTLCSRMSVMLPDDSGSFLRIAKASGIEASVIGSVRLAIGQSIAGKVFARGQFILVNDQEDAERNLDKCDQRIFANLPLLSTPIRSSEEVVGVLNLTGCIGEKPFDPRELGYLDLVCNYAASAIQNIRAREARDRAGDSIVIALAQLAEHRDDDTGKHLDRVTSFCMTLASAMREQPAYADQIDAEFIKNLERAAPLHDIGKVAIPDAILLKPGKLSDSEMSIMRTHVDIGAETLRSVRLRSPESSFLRMAEQIAQSHHERMDGNGYPRGLRGKDIPLAARILAVADVYDALTTKRVYKEAVAHRKAVEIILQEAGTHFDSDVIKAFLRVEPEFERLAGELADTAGKGEQRAEPVASGPVQGP